MDSKFFVCSLFFSLFALPDRTYQPSCASQGPIDYGFLKRLFDRLLDEAIPALQRPSEAQQKVKNKSFLTAGPYGNVPVQACMSLALRILRLSPTHSPKQARVEKRVFDEVIAVAGNDVHTQAWRLIDFLVDNTEWGMTGFEPEMAELCAERLRSDLKAAESLSPASKRALNGFARIAQSMTAGFNGSLFVRELAKSGVLSECAQFLAGQIGLLLKRGPHCEESETAKQQPQNKRARYYQAAQSEKDRQAAAMAAFSEEVSAAVALFMQPMAVFSCGQSVLSPEEHCKLAGQLIALHVTFQRASRNFSFLRDFNAQFYSSLTEAAVTFQPAYLPPFLAHVMRILAAGAHESKEARMGLLRIETLVHPRRKGPIVFRPASEAVIRAFEREEVAVEERVACEEAVAEERVACEETGQPATLASEPTAIDKPVPVEPSLSVLSARPLEQQPPPSVTAGQAISIETPVFSAAKPTTQLPADFIRTGQVVKPAPSQSRSELEGSKVTSRAIKDDNNNDNDDDNDDEPLPQIIDCEPDEQ